MFLHRILLVLAFATLPVARPLAQQVRDTGRGILVTIPHPIERAAKVVRLEVVGDRIIRVTASPEASLPKKQPSLMVVPEAFKQKARYTVEQTDETVTLRAAEVSAEVCRATGRITFRDAAGKVLLEEAKDGRGKQFTPFTVPEREIGCTSLKTNPATALTPAQRNGWTWHARFESPQDEAFYGLGQHQAEDMNYKGVDEELFQYNTKVSVPFVVSNRNYGLLWDSYSFCRWGNAADYLQLHRAFILYDRGGNRGHLTGIYVDAQGRKLVRDEDSLYYENAEVIGNLPQGFNLDGARVTYEGYLQAPATAQYRFLLYYAGYVRVFIDGREVVPERWRTAWNPNSYKFSVALEADRRVPVRIEWQPDGGVSYCALRVAQPQPEAEQQRLSIWSEMARDMDYYFVAGRNLDEVIAGYRTLTGRAPVYPKWALGFWQSRERYKSSADVEGTLAEFRRRHIPVDNIVQDWNYWKLDSWGDHTFEVSRFPHPQAMLDSVHQMHGRFMISVWPKFYDSVEHYRQLDAKGWMYRQAIKDSIYDWLGFMGSFYDAYDPDARKLFWRQMDLSLYSKYRFGIDAWWMDASEPNVRDCTPMWYRKALSGPTAMGSSTEYFNAYSLVNADAIYNGQRSANPNQRVFLLTRSGFAGLQRYSTATWSGDIATRWEDLRAQMTAGLNYCIAGLPFWGMDQGGFCVERRYEAAQRAFDATGEESEDLREWRELQARWHQFGCFIPLYRAHGQWPLREVWNIAPEGHPAYESIVWHHRLRYHLMPYLYSMAGWVHFRHYTMMRALVMDFNGDAKVENIKDQWMFGPSLMACPVGYYGARERTVYLPRQRGWYDLYTGHYQQGGQTVTAEAPYERIPVFVPSGSILPLGPAMEWSDERPADPIRLYVYAGGDASFQLYEDEGTNYNYERGQYATIPLRYDETTRTLTFGRREGRFKGMLQQRTFEVVYVTPDKPQPLQFEGTAAHTVHYDGSEQQIQL
ncbi:MAG: DUF5110 domain-containing protein [Bacteroidaceae bacterium]|nr:DUF5110 domain-containing protein [Bacteroidaceae bacterium]